MGKGPTTFQFFDDNKARNTIEERYVQKLVNHFKEYIESANELYKTIIHRHKKKQEEEERHRLQAKIEEEERRQRILKSVKV